MNSRKRYASSNGTYLRRAKNRNAFYGVLESYGMIKSNSLVKIMDTSDISGGTPNPAAPSTIDFICDVENIIKKHIQDEETLRRFYDVLYGIKDFSKEQMFKYEQGIGKLFIMRQIWPVHKYFTVQRRKQ